MNLTPKLLNSLTQFVTDSPEALEPKDLIALYQQLAGIKKPCRCSKRLHYSLSSRRQ